MESKGVTTSNSLSGLKVVELASVLAGPAVGTFLAELGAEVIKIENPITRGDMTRHWKLPTEDSSIAHSAYFCSVNWGKEHRFLNLKEEEGRAEVLKLLSEADIVVSNYKPGDDKKLGVDYGTVKALNPKVIYGHLTGYGDDDPRPAFDVALQAETGYMSMNGQSTDPPTKLPLAFIDILAAHQLKQGIVLALYQREKTGEGSYITTSLKEAALSGLTNQATNWLMGNHVPQRIGSLHPNIAPYGEILTTSDGLESVLAVGTDQQFENLCQVLRLKNISEDDKFNSNVHRVSNREVLHSILNNAAKKLTRSQLVDQLDELKVPVGAILNVKEVFEDEANQNILLKETMPDGSESVRPAQVAFNLK